MSPSCGAWRSETGSCAMGCFSYMTYNVDFASSRVGQLRAGVDSRSYTLDFSRIGKPTDNAYIESFNGSFREECWTVHWFKDLTDAQAKIQVWKQEYNEDRPHQSLKNLTPLQNKAQLHTQRSKNCLPRGPKIGVPSIMPLPHYRTGPKLRGRSLLTFLP